MQPTGMTNNAQVLVKNLLSKSIKRSPTLQPAQSAIQLYSAMFDEQWHAAFHMPCTLGFAGMRWLSFPSFMGAEILPYGSVGYNHPSQRTRQSGHHVFKGCHGRAFERTRYVS